MALPVRQDRARRSLVVVVKSLPNKAVRSPSSAPPLVSCGGRGRHRPPVGLWRERAVKDRMSFPFLYSSKIHNSLRSSLLSRVRFCHGLGFREATTICLGSEPPRALAAFDVIFIHLFCGYYCGRGAARGYGKKTTLPTTSTPPPLSCRITTAKVGSVTSLCRRKERLREVFLTS